MEEKKDFGKVHRTVKGNKAKIETRGTDEQKWHRLKGQTEQLLKIHITKL